MELSGEKLEGHRRPSSNQSVDGQYVEEGWVDKSCKVCKKDIRGKPRKVDKFGRYVHVACLEKSNAGNFFTRPF